MKNMTEKALRSRIDEITNQIDEIMDVPVSRFKSGRYTVKGILANLIELRDMYKKELKSRNAE